MSKATNSRKDTWLYWSLTGLLSAFMAFSGVFYLTSPEATAAFQHLGFPSYFRVELAIAKLLGAAALLLPISARVKEWAYAGFAITFVSAAIAHSASGDPATAVAAPIVALLVLFGSYRAYRRRRGD